MPPHTFQTPLSYTPISHYLPSGTLNISIESHPIPFLHHHHLSPFPHPGEHIISSAASSLSHLYSNKPKNQFYFPLLQVPLLLVSQLDIRAIPAGRKLINPAIERSSHGGSSIVPVICSHSGHVLALAPATNRGSSRLIPSHGGRW